MRLTCPYCQSRAIIYSHPKPEGRIEQFYCECKNPECSARFVYRAHFSHMLQPPISTLTDSLHEQIAHMDPDQRKELLKPYLQQPLLF